jgi:hypothetical protein
MFKMGQYIPDPTGLPTDIAEAEYSAENLTNQDKKEVKPQSFIPSFRHG